MTKRFLVDFSIDWHKGVTMATAISMKEKTTKYKELLTAAREAYANSYAPYTQYRVGVALLTATGDVIRGCNVENVVYNVGLCAERTAVAKAVSEGHRQFEAIALACEKTYDTWPCGACRQFLHEFAPELTVISETANGQIKIKSLRELFPDSFGPEHVLGSNLKAT